MVDTNEVSDEDIKIKKGLFKKSNIETENEVSRPIMYIYFKFRTSLDFDSYIFEDINYEKMITHTQLLKRSLPVGILL